ncbi:MAG: hypothetical protein HRT36_06635 [Alphaproteobacteria bacterium]|nr:hypothetical protein [Alphaproteobacteria bacterium]
MKSKSAEYLIVTNKQDLTSDFIVREMQKRGLGFARLNTEDLPSMAVIQNDCKLGTSIQLDDTLININSVKSAYFRRPKAPVVSDRDLPVASRTYCTEEWSYLLRSIYLELDQKWFSHPNDIILAEDKPKQLRLAKEIGFNIPETVITNNLENVIYLFTHGPVIAKPMKHALLEELGKERVIFTSTIHSLSDVKRDELKLAPVIFQRKIIKEHDVRVIVVGDIIFAVAIDSQAHTVTETDWRHTAVDRLEHHVVKLNEDISDQCRTIVRRLGLRYGAIDLVLDKRGKHWFLECNPNGQWAWIENRTSLPIAASIVDIMEDM